MKGRRILLGITGSISAYKSAFLTRLFIKEGAEVQIVATADALGFITALTLSTLSNRPVYSTFSEDETGVWNNHVDLALWADVMIIAPASANTMAKMATGICDNLLMATYLSAKCDVFFAPAMDLDMYKHETTIKNIATLQKNENILIGPGTGALASGLSGEGRMAEPEDIVELLRNYFTQKEPLAGKKCLVTAGPTYEAIDPVRFIGNHSSGKMGFAIAEELAMLGANVTLIAGPTALKTNDCKIKRINVVSAADMLNAVEVAFSDAQITIMAAAVADYTPVNVSDSKIKKNDAEMSIELTKTVDILAKIGKIKKPKQFLMGFALETNNGEEYARQKLVKKNLDAIVLNTMQDAGAGFGHDTNKISIIEHNKIVNFELKSKREVAKDIVAYILKTVK